MKASELLRKYAAGERDFRRVSLRGQSFKGKDLSGADFSEADIRGTNFKEAHLTGANFSQAQAGLENRWAILLVIYSWLLSAFSGFMSGFIGYILVLIFHGFLENQIEGWIALFILIAVVIIITIRQGIGVRAVAFAFTFAFIFAFGFASAFGFGFGFALTFAIAVAFGFAGAFAIAVTFGFAGVFTFAIAFDFSRAFAGAFAFVFAGIFAGAFAFVFAGIFAGILAEAFAGAFAVTLFSAYIAWRAMQGDEKQALIGNIAVVLTATGGTSFYRANLTDANFTGAKLKSTDLRKANLTRTRWRKAQKLDQVRPGTSYLKSSQLRKWLIGEGEDKNFNGQNLRGINLQGANLTDASFIGADLSEANLQNADLSRAKLAQTQLAKTDLTGATLTGAFIEDWGITGETKFDGVRCEYVYMRLPTPDNPDPWRKPENKEEVFEDGEFGDFIKPIIDTLDLYHNQEVDPRAIAISFKQLAENNSNAQLRIVGMEVRGEDKFLLRAKTAETIDKSQLSAKYFEIYNKIKALAEQEIKALIEEKDNRIRSLETMVTTALKSPSFYAENYQNQGDTKVSDENRNINIGRGNYNEKIEGDYIQGNYYAGEAKQTLAEASTEIQQLLQQLEQTYPSNTTGEKMAVATEVIKRIESNTPLADKILSALKVGGAEALKQTLNHPTATFVLAALEDWQNK